MIARFSTKTATGKSKSENIIRFTAGWQPQGKVIVKLLLLDLCCQPAAGKSNQLLFRFATSYLLKGKVAILICHRSQSVAFTLFKF